METQKLGDAYDSEMLERGMRKTKLLTLGAKISHSLELFGDRPFVKIGLKKKECEPKLNEQILIPKD